MIKDYAVELIENIEKDLKKQKEEVEDILKVAEKNLKKIEARKK